MSKKRCVWSREANKVMRENRTMMVSELHKLPELKKYTRLQLYTKRANMLRELKLLGLN